MQVRPALALDVAPFDHAGPAGTVAAEFEALRSDAVAEAARELLPDARDRRLLRRRTPTHHPHGHRAAPTTAAIARITAETYVAAYTDLRHARRLVELDQAEQAVSDQLEATPASAAEADPDELGALEATERELTAALTDIALARSLGTAGSTTAFGETTRHRPARPSRTASPLRSVRSWDWPPVSSSLLAAQRLTPTFVTAEDVGRDDLPAPLLAVMPPTDGDADLQGPAGDPYRALRSELGGPRHRRAPPCCS